MCARHRVKKEPRTGFLWCGAYTWRRPTLTGPVVPLPSALRRFTSGFGMGPGGSTALWSPEFNIGSRLAGAVGFQGCSSGGLSFSLPVFSFQFSGGRGSALGLLFTEN